jgi:excisionase family DNA binding protein
MEATPATAHATEPLWTAEDVAAFLRVSLSMVYKLRRMGTLRAVRVGALFRFEPDVVRAFTRTDPARVGSRR